MYKRVVLSVLKKGSFDADYQINNIKNKEDSNNEFSNLLNLIMNELSEKFINKYKLNLYGDKLCYSSKELGNLYLSYNLLYNESLSENKSLMVNNIFNDVNKGPVCSLGLLNEICINRDLDILKSDFKNLLDTIHNKIDNSKFKNPKSIIRSFNLVKNSVLNSFEKNELEKIKELAKSDFTAFLKYLKDYNFSCSTYNILIYIMLEIGEFYVNDLSFIRFCLIMCDEHWTHNYLNLYNFPNSYSYILSYIYYKIYENLNNKNDYLSIYNLISKNSDEYIVVNGYEFFEIKFKPEPFYEL